jgi:hypothetical protein
MIPVETVLKSGEGIWGRAVEGVNPCMMYLIHCKNLCKCNNVPPPSTTIKKRGWGGNQKTNSTMLNEITSWIVIISK